MKDLQLLLKEMENYKIITRPRILKCYAYSNVQNSLVSAGSRDFEYHHAEPFLHFKIIASASSLFAKLFEKNQIYKNNPRRFETFVLFACTKILLGK